MGIGTGRWPQRAAPSSSSIATPRWASTTGPTSLGQESSTSTSTRLPGPDRCRLTAAGWLRILALCSLYTEQRELPDGARLGRAGPCARDRACAASCRGLAARRRNPRPLAGHRQRSSHRTPPPAARLPPRPGAPEDRERVLPPL